MRLILLTLLLTQSCLAQQCNPAGNLWIFSNYDGSNPNAASRLNIVVDVNIPNIRIGICSYERVTVNISGPFAANVTAVRYAGYNATGNCNCGTVAGCANNTVITGVPAGIITYAYIPPVFVNDPNGYSSLICAYQCTSGNQGGCNTASQVVNYFQNTLGGTFRAHTTQYSCWSGATHNLSTTGNCCLVVPLGVSLLDFDVEKVNERTFIHWKTDREIDNDYFEIETSLDGFNWITLEQVDGNGTTNKLKEYSFWHNNPSTGNNYYRLKQVDFDGTIAYSEIRMIENKDVINECYFFPNPSNGIINLINPYKNTKDVQIRILDLQGKIVFSDIIYFSKTNYVLDLSFLEKGFYHIEFEEPESKLTYTNKLYISN